MAHPRQLSGEGRAAVEQMKQAIGMIDEGERPLALKDFLEQVATEVEKDRIRLTERMRYTDELAQLLPKAAAPVTRKKKR